MNRQKRIKKIKFTTLGQRLRILTVALVMAVGTYFLVQTQAAAGYIYISPATSNKYVGDTFAVQVRIRTTSPINAAFVNINYNGRGLQVLGIQRGSSFPNQNAPTQHTPSSTGTGTIKMQSTRNSSVTGDLHYATITFKATKTGVYGVLPVSGSRLINYPSNDVSFTTGRADYTFTTRPTPPPPAPSPPKPTPRPAAPAPRTPPSTPSTVKVPKTQSTPSVSNLKISDFSIHDVGYRSAVVSWKTNKPAVSKVNYGFSSDDMPYETASQTKTATHKLTIQGGAIRAGNFYAVRITSNDGKSRVTLDGEFSTKGVVIVVKVTDSQGQAVAGAQVSTDTLEVTTDDQGTAELAVPEGSIAISAKKDDLRTDFVAEVAIPESEDAAPQEVAVVLDPSSASVQNNQGNRWLLIVPVLLSVMSAVALGVFIRRRRQQAVHYNTYSADTDIGVPPTPPENLHPPAPTSPPPIPMSGDQSLPHYTSLSELVQQDLGAKRKNLPQQEEPVDMFSVLDNPKSAPPQPAHTTELQPTASSPEPKTSQPEAQTPVETPKADPPKPTRPEAEATPEEPEQPSHKDAEIDPTDHSLHINHDN